MTESFISYIIIVIIILFLVMFAQKARIAYPIVLVVGGLVLSLTNLIPPIHIDPKLIFIIFLPPLLYEAAWFTSWKNFWRWRRVITSFAFLIVIVTSFIVAEISTMMIPGFTLAMGFLLGGIVSPPDAVSATAILKHVKIPKTLTSILEGESLLNDASSLIVFQFAVLAVSTGEFIFHEAVGQFFFVILVGIAVGLAVALIYYAIHRWLPTDPNIDIILTLTAPYVMYIVAEELHVSGVLATVTGGLFLSSRSHTILSYSSRLRGMNVWSALGFVLNGLVFMLIGLQLPMIVEQLGAISLKEAIWYGVLISLVLIVARILCTLGASVFTRFISRFITTADSNPGWRGPLIFGWAGMRGVVSLAAALSIPLTTTAGQPFPMRNLILFITFTVILITLVVQGLTLPLVIKWVNPEDRDHFATDESQHHSIRKELADMSIKFLEKNGIHTNNHVKQLKSRYETQLTITDHDENHLQRDYQKIYLDLLEEQRNYLYALNRKKETSEEVVRTYLSMIDLEEEKLHMNFRE